MCQILSFTSAYVYLYNLSIRTKSYLKQGESMEILRVLKKSNIYSVIVAIIIATAVGSTMMMTLQEPATLLSGIDKNELYGGAGGYQGGPGWQTMYLQPVILLALQLLVLEALCRIAVAISKKSK